MGDDIYDFSYEVESVVVGPVQKYKVGTSVTKDSFPPGKRARTETGSQTLVDSSGNNGGAQNTYSESVNAGHTQYTSHSAWDSEIQVESSDDSSNHTELLIDTIARDQNVIHVQLPTSDDGRLIVNKCILTSEIP